MHATIVFIYKIDSRNRHNRYLLALSISDPNRKDREIRTFLNRNTVSDGFAK